MSLLVNKFRAEVAKSKDYGMKAEAEMNISYPTGFITYDFRNGALVQGIDEKGVPCPYYSVGIQDGSLVMVVGRSSSGKTTWVIQAAFGIISSFEHSAVYFDNIEGGITKERIGVLTGHNQEYLDKKCIERNTSVTAENFYERVRLIHSIKEENRQDFEYDTGKYDGRGNRIFKLQPTVYILDSLALLMPGKYTQEEELSGQMSTTAAAKMNAMIFRRLIPIIKQSNIILFVINHINQAVSLSLVPKAAQLSFLKQDETLPGGNTPIYLSNIIVRVDDVSKLNEEKNNLDGAKIRLSLVKSRNNKAGQFVHLILDQNIGFDKDLSLLELLKDHKRINGAGRGQYLGELTDSTVKFSGNNFKEKLAQNPEFVKQVHAECLDILKGFLNEMHLEEEDGAENTEEKVVSVTDMFMEQLMTA